MYSRRHLVAVVLVFTLILTAGCTGSLLGDGPVEYESGPVSVSDSALSEAGYLHDTSDSVTVNRTVEFGDGERELAVTNHVATYERSVRDGGRAFFVVLSTPEVEVAGQALNPLTRVEKETLLERVASRRSEIRSVEPVGSFETAVLGDDRTVDTFDARARVDGGTADFTLHAVRFEHDGEYVIGIGAYPDGYDGQEGVTALLGGIEHETSA